MSPCVQFCISGGPSGQVSKLRCRTSVEIHADIIVHGEHIKTLDIASEHCQRARVYVYIYEPLLRGLFNLMFTKDKHVKYTHTRHSYVRCVISLSHVAMCLLIVTSLYVLMSLCVFWLSISIAYAARGKSHGERQSTCPHARNSYVRMIDMQLLAYRYCNKHR